MPSKTDFSLLILAAVAGSFQISGFSNSKLTSSRRSFLFSMSKIPPKFELAGLEVGELVGDGVEAFCFHGQSPDE